MTDQNHYPSDRNDPNRWGSSPEQGDVAGQAGNASGGQYPTGQPGEYSERDAATPAGQFGQPGEYAGGPTADDHVGRPSEQSQQHPGSYGTASYGTGPYGTDPYATAPNPTGQYPNGQYAPGHDGSAPNSTGQYPAPNGQGASPFDQSAFTEQPRRQPRQRTDENGEPYGVGPFSLREAIVAGLAILLLIASFLPLVGGEYAEFIGYSNLWGPAPWLVIPGALLFVAAAALLVLRRVVPTVNWRVGSLSVDQFASAAAIVTAGFHLGAILLMLGLGVWFGGLNDGFAPGAGPILGLIVSLAAIALTTFASVIPPFAADFRDRPESPAHRLARAAKPVPQRPKPAPEQAQAWTAPNAESAPASASYADPNAGWQHQAASVDPWPGAVAPSTPAPASAGQPTPSHEAAPPTAAYAYRDDRGAEAVDRSRVESETQIHDAREPLVVFGDGSASTSAASAPSHDTEQPVDTSVFTSPESHSSDPHTSESPLSEPPATAPTASEFHTPGAPVSGAVAEPIAAEQAPAAPAAFAPYWVLAPEQRPVVDLTSGAPLFEVGPTAWSLAVGERDGGLVIRADDGRIGLLRDADGLTRG